MIHLSRLHQTVIAKIGHDASWSHQRVAGTDFVNKTELGGYNARTLSVLRRLGLVESAVFTGSRGGRIVGIKLTEAGRAVAERIGAIIEGYAPVTEPYGNFDRVVGGFELVD